MGNEKWILYNNVERKRSWGQTKWTNINHTKVQSSSKEGDVYIVGLEGSPLLCSQLDPLKAALHKKRLEVVHRKPIIFHQDIARLHVNTRMYQILDQPLKIPTEDFDSVTEH